MLELLIEIALANNNNAITKYCIKKIEGSEVANLETADWGKIGYCAEQLRAAQRQLDYAELKQFLDENPYYRYPGVALPNGAKNTLDECWGKTRKYHTDKGC